MDGGNHPNRTIITLSLVYFETCANCEWRTPLRLVTKMCKTCKRTSDVCWFARHAQNELTMQMHMYNWVIRIGTNVEVTLQMCAVHEILS